MSEIRTRPAILFDLDGTLIDSLPDVVGAANRVLAAEGRRAITVAEARGLIGEGAAPLIRGAFAATGDPVDDDDLTALIDRYLAEYHTVPVRETTIFAGVVEALEDLSGRGFRLGVCTNKPHKMSVIVLAALDLARHFDTVIGGDFHEFKKPDPRHAFAVLDALDGTAQSAVFVGDSAIDMTTARNAGIASVAVSHGYSRVAPEVLDADMLIGSFADLPEAVAELLRRPLAARRRGTERTCA